MLAVLKTILTIICCFILCLIIFVVVGVAMQKTAENSHRCALRHLCRRVGTRLYTIKDTHPCYIVFGTLLGYRREKDIILGDEDVDFATTASNEDLEAAIDKVRSALALDDSLIIKRSSQRVLKACDRKQTNASCDVYFYNDVDDKNIVYEGGPRMEEKKSEIYPLEKTRFLGIDVFVPKNVDEHLQKWYGHDFITPRYDDKGAGRGVELGATLKRYGLVWRYILGIRKSIVNEHK